ncbi:hypothetical protein B0H17DRAFT_1198436 [Mycena rosella]|uniref:Uncharacterized protein n=1 Tax=Mycena rosella TaxID=1033263 RepID=A0AAD7GHS9_MYCRO|nr:hypothetical protein B0H17DRAFT_1198436 [Mycena rosella]
MDLANPVGDVDFFGRYIASEYAPDIVGIGVSDLRLVFKFRRKAHDRIEPDWIWVVFTPEFLRVGFYIEKSVSNIKVREERFAPGGGSKKAAFPAWAPPAVAPPPAPPGAPPPVPPPLLRRLPLPPLRLWCLGVPLPLSPLPFTGAPPPPPPPRWRKAVQLRRTPKSASSRDRRET